MIGVVVAGTLLSRHSAVETNSVQRRRALGRSPLSFIMQFVVLWGYYLLFEGLSDGQTPGKVFSVCAPFATAATPSDSPRRRCAISSHHRPSAGVHVSDRHHEHLAHEIRQTTGDIVAGTIVVREATVETTGPARANSDASASPGHRAAHRRRVSTSRSLGRSAEQPRTTDVAAHPSPKSPIVFGTPFPLIRARARRALLRLSRR